MRNPSGGGGADMAAAELRSIADKLGYPWQDSVSVEGVDQSLLAKIPFQFARACLAVPLRMENGKVIVATARPLESGPLDDMRLIFGAPLDIHVASAETMLAAVNRAYDLSSGTARETMDDIAGDADLDALVHALPEDLLETSAEAPVIRLVNSILVQAAKEKASDIHIEPYERELGVRFRIDGVLRNVVSPPKKLQSLIVSRIKIMAGLDIAEKRLPQDGRLKIVIGGKDIDIRISVIPTAHGERVVMRLLDKATMLLGFSQVGLRGVIHDRLEKLIHAPHGVILVSGPTGSGKTTTLYAALSRINSPDKNIITVEDPVEYQLPGVGQMQVNTKIGLTFASGLRSILRQDPDVIMVGEIRDRETAQIAVQASLTGHLVFSTIHTNDAAGSVTRLVDMGIEPFLLASSLLASLAQRLVRVLCPACKAPYTPSSAHMVELYGEERANRDRPDVPFYRAVGCAECNGLGYRGRTGIFELLVIDDDVRADIVRRADSVAIKNAAIKHGFTAMREYGAMIVEEGITSVEEVARVTTESD